MNLWTLQRRSNVRSLVVWAFGQENRDPKLDSQVGFPPRALKSFQFFLHNHLNQSSPRERVWVHFTFPALCSDWPKVTQADFTPITSLRKINETAISFSMCQNVSMTTELTYLSGSFFSSCIKGKTLFRDWKQKYCAFGVCYICLPFSNTKRPNH